MVGFIVFLVIVFIIALIIIAKGAYVVKQQTYAIIERLGKYRCIVTPGFHIKVPIIDVIAARVDMRVHQSDFNISAKTQDNVNISLHIASQYQVNQDDPDGIYKSYYKLSNPIQQMESYLVDALRSAIPTKSLDQVYDNKDDIANDVNTSVAEMMGKYGFKVISTLITDINLPQDVEDSMNKINAAQREKVAAQDLAEADKIKLVTEATAKAEASEQAGVGIAKQRQAIADGISSSLSTIQQAGVSSEEANELFMYTQYMDVLESFAKSGNVSTVILPSNFKETRSMFEQIVSANKVTNNDFVEK